MHVAEIRINADDYSLSYRAHGHAGEAPIGTNIVCAVCSHLAFTLAQIIKDAYSSEWVGDDTVIEVIDPENVEISCYAADNDTFGELVRIFLVIGNSYKLLADNYPDRVQLITEIKA